MHWYIDVLKKYAVFSGRAQRAEYWMFLLINLIISIAIGIFSSVTGMVSENGISILSSLYSLGIIIPSIAVTVRRLHDIDKSGWWILMSLIPFIGIIVLLIFMIRDSQVGTNRYGSNPKEIKTVQQ